MVGAGKRFDAIERRPQLFGPLAQTPPRATLWRRIAQAHRVDAPVPTRHHGGHRGDAKAGGHFREYRIDHELNSNRRVCGHARCLRRASAVVALPRRRNCWLVLVRDATMMRMSCSPSGNLGDIVKTDAPGGAYIDLADGRHYAPAKIDQDAGRFAQGMIDHGLQRGARVAIIADNGAPLIIAYLGLMRAGLVPVMVNHKLPPATIAFIVEDSGAVLVLADAAHEQLVPPGIPRLHLGAIGALLGETPLPPVRPTAGEIAEILYTSGSTGRPKGVPLSHDGQVWAMDQFLAVSDRPERTVIAAPAYHMNGLFFSAISLALGSLIVSLPRFEAGAYLRAVAEYRCTLLSGVPTMFVLMARERDLLATLDLSSVQDIIIGSAPLSAAVTDRMRTVFPNANVRNSYGTTETGPAMFGPHPDGLPRPELAIGYPYPGVEWRLSDGDTPDEGVLETRTPATLKAYLNLPDATADSLHEGWYTTGDIMRRDDNGFFHFLRRVDDMFVCGGENVYPDEVERLLERHPDVGHAAVVAVEDDVKGMIPIAFVVAREGHVIDPAALKQFSLSEGPPYSHPRAIEVVDHLPAGTTFKVDLSLLRARATEIAHTLRR